MLTEKTLPQSVTPEEKLRRRLSSISNLPSPPLVFNQLSKIINNPKTSVRDVAGIMSEDAAMSAKVLRLSNSAFYGAKSEIVNIKQAVMVLGLEAIKSLVLSSSVFDMFKSHKVDAEFQEEYWRHSLATALAAKLVTRYNKVLKNLDPEIAFSAGLLHDIGKLIYCCFMQDEYAKIKALAKAEGLSDYQAEESITGFNHTLVGKILAENWKLPLPIQTAIAEHHFPRVINADSDNYGIIIHLANYIAKKAFSPRVPQYQNWSQLLPEVYAYLALSDEIVDAFSHQLIDEYTKSSTFMQMALG